MILLLLILSSLPALILGDCGCEEVWKGIAGEKKEDEKNFACRSCSNPVVSADAACPVSGFECNEKWQITSNVLTPGDTCRCSQAKCAGKARLASDRNIINKMSCIDRKWIVDDDIEAEPVVCAKPCHSKICAVKYTEALPDFDPLKFHEAGKENACAVGYCEAGYAPMIINEDGNPGDALEEGMKLTCKGDGLWKTDENQHKYVMCKKNPSKTCNDCDPALIVISTDADAKPMQAPIDTSGPCTKIIFACGEPNALNTAIQINGGADFQDSHDGTSDGVANFQVVCDASGTLWIWKELPNYPITSLKCTFTPAPPKTCKDCDPALITISMGGDAKPMTPMETNGVCKTLTYACGQANPKATDALIGINNNGALAFPDAADGNGDGVANFPVVCDASGTSWKSSLDQSITVTSLTCTFTPPAPDPCKSCDPAWITDSTAAGDKPTTRTRDDSGTCSKVDFACGQTGAIMPQLRINGNTVIGDTDDNPVADGVAHVVVECDPTGPAWKWTKDTNLEITSFVCQFQ